MKRINAPPRMDLTQQAYGILIFLLTNYKILNNLTKIKSSTIK